MDSPYQMIFLVATCFIKDNICSLFEGNEDNEEELML